MCDTLHSQLIVLSVIQLKTVRQNIGYVRSETRRDFWIETRVPGK